MLKEQSGNGKKLRITTNQPGVYKNTKTGKYDVKYNYTEIDLATGKKRYRGKWVYGINSYKVAVSTLVKLKRKNKPEMADGFSLEQALSLWIDKAEVNRYSPVSIGNTRQQFNMITRFWTPSIAIENISEEGYLHLIAQCREYGYSEETIWNINACLRKLINLAYKNRYISENPIDFWDSPRIKPGAKRYVIPLAEYEKIEKYFRENKFMRLGHDCHAEYVFLVAILYWTGMRIGEVLALQYDDFEECAHSTSEVGCNHMRISVTKSYNSAYKLLKNSKNDKSRKIPIPHQLIRIYKSRLNDHILHGGSIKSQIFGFTHGSCNTVLGRACKSIGIREYNCHDFRHTYISNLIRHAVPISVIEAVSGDTQETIFRRYSHMFEGDEELVLRALE